MAVSFITGRIVYISDQASIILNCKREVFKGATFAEFLAPQDVSVFYGSTAPYHLPSWSSCTSGGKTSTCSKKSKIFCPFSRFTEETYMATSHPAGRRRQKGATHLPLLQHGDPDIREFSRHIFPIVHGYIYFYTWSLYVLNHHFCIPYIDTASMDYTQEKSVFCRIRWVLYIRGEVEHI